MSCWKELREENHWDPVKLAKYMTFDNGFSHWSKIQSFFKYGFFIDSGKWTDILKYHCMGDMTFLEAYQKTGRVLAILATPSRGDEPIHMLSYLTAPHCLIRSACVASASIPYLLPTSNLLFKNPITGEVTENTTIYTALRDGSFLSDVPNIELAYYFNTSFHLVSQVNPHISIFYFNRHGTSSRTQTHWGWSNFRGTFLLSFFESVLKYDMIKNLQIMKEMKLFPNFLGFGDISNVFLQNFGGPTHSSISLVPDTTFTDYLGLFSAPTPQHLRNMIKGGEMMLFLKKSLLDNRLLVSKAMLEGVQCVEVEMGRGLRPKHLLYANSSTTTLGNFETFGDLKQFEQNYGKRLIGMTNLSLVNNTNHTLMSNAVANTNNHYPEHQVVIGQTPVSVSPHKLVANQNLYGDTNSNVDSTNPSTFTHRHNNKSTPPKKTNINNENIFVHSRSDRDTREKLDDQKHN